MKTIKPIGASVSRTLKEGSKILEQMVINVANAFSSAPSIAHGLNENGGEG